MVPSASLHPRVPRCKVCLVLLDPRGILESNCCRHTRRSELKVFEHNGARRSSERVRKAVKERRPIGRVLRGRVSALDEIVQDRRLRLQWVLDIRATTQRPRFLADSILTLRRKLPRTINAALVRIGAEHPGSRRHYSWFLAAVCLSWIHERASEL